MSISTTATKDSYAGNNSIVTQYPITFKYFEEGHISVYFDGVLQTKGAGADYVMGGDGTTSTGYITTNVAQAGTVTVAITLDVPFDQPVVLQETGSLPAKTIEVEGFDRLNMQVRRVWRKLQDVLTFNTDEAGASTGTADNLIGFDGSGDIAEIPNTTFVQTANNLSDVDAATARANLGVDAAGTDNSTDVTKAGTGTYVSLDTGTQVLTVDPIDEADLNASINASLDKADTSIQSLASIEGNSLLSTGATVGQVLQSDGDTTCSFIDLIGGGNAQTANPLSQFAATTSAQLAGVISDETGTGSLVFATSPALVTPDLGTPSAVDLTNATNYPETNGTVTGTDNIRDTRLVTASNAVTPDPRGINSLDLQPFTTLATQVASADGAVLLGGLNNTASGVRSTALSGTGAVSSGSNSIVAGGYGNTASGEQTGVYSGHTNTASGNFSAVVAGNNNIASGGESFIAGGQAGTAANAGSRVFPDSTATAITSRQQNEFTIQASALRLEDGNEAVGKVLICNNADGSSNWAAPAKVVYTVATLPATPAQGDVAIVTDALTPAFLSAVASGGAVVTPVFWNGTAWIVG